MRIGFDAKRLFNNFTGLGNHCRTVIDILTEYYPENEYILYTPKIRTDSRTEPYLSKTGCRTVTPGSFIQSSFWRTFLISGIADKDGLDLFHGLSNEIPVNLRKPSVVTIHDVAFKTFPDMYHIPDRIIYNAKWKYACSHADKIVAISTCTKNDIIEYYGVDPDKIDVVYQPVNNIYYSDNHGIRPQLPKKIKDHSYMLYVGSINSRKNLLGVIKAIELLPDDLRIPLVVIGNGREYKQEVLHYITDHNLNDLVVFPSSHIGTAQLRYLYANATMLVYPSFYEGFGLPVVEAMLSNCPVITSNISSMPEAAGPDSLLVDPYDIGDISDKMVRLLTDETLRLETVSKGYAYASDRFNPKRLAQSLMNTYQSIL